jgi:RNA polymerase sigma factor (TIGR02999 family)
MPAVTNTSKPITQLLQRWQQGDAAALEEVSPLVYQELHKFASRAMRHEREGHTLCTTALINEAMLHLMGSTIHWRDRQHFYRVSARQMRRILVDHARARQCKKRGGDSSVEVLDEDRLAATELDFDVLDIDTALSDLAQFDQRKHDMVELYYFAGLTVDETARLLELSGKTVQRELRLAKAWLHHALTPEDNAG